MAIHYGRSGFGGNAGRAAVPLTQTFQNIAAREQRQQALDQRDETLKLQALRDIARDQNEKRRLEILEANARATREARLIEQRRKDRAAANKAMNAGMELGAEMGFPWDQDGFTEIDQALFEADPEVWEAMNRRMGRPTGTDDPLFASSYMARAEALKMTRQAQSAAAKGEAHEQFMAEAEMSGYTPEETATMIAAYEDPDVSFADYDNQRADVRDAAKKRAIKVEQMELSKEKATALFRQHPTKIMESDRLSDIAGRLMTGQSENPELDMMRLTIGAEFGDAALGELEADMFTDAIGAVTASQEKARAMAAAKLEAGRELAEQSLQPQPRELPFPEYAPGTSPTPQPGGPEEVTQYAEEDAPIASRTTRLPELSEEEDSDAGFEQWAATSGFDLETPEGQARAEREWAKVKKARQFQKRSKQKKDAQLEGAAQKAQSPGGKLHGAVMGGTKEDGIMTIQQWAAKNGITLRQSEKAKQLEAYKEYVREAKRMHPARRQYRAAQKYNIHPYSLPGGF